MKKELTPKQFASVVETTIQTINKVVEAVPIMCELAFFNEKEFRKNGMNQLILEVCEKFEVNEDHIRKVGKWVKK